MGLIDFVKDAGRKLFGGDDDKPAPKSGGNVDMDELRRKAEEGRERHLAKALVDEVNRLGLEVDDLGIRVEDDVAIVTGKADTQEVREKVVLAVGNHRGIAKVDDRMTVDKAGGEATLYTVQKGDTLSGIAKKHYGNASKYMKIFEANRPMLEDPDKIYPGQVLRIPADS